MTMAAKRYDTYRLIHKALRARMFDCVLFLGKNDDSEMLAPVLERSRSLLDACKQHLDHENDFIHTAIEVHRPLACQDVREEHQHHEASIHELRILIQKVELGAAPLTLLYDSMTLFVADNLQHMAYEETIMNGILWSLFNDEQIIAIEQRMVASFAPEVIDATLEWMLPWNNSSDRDKFLGLLKVAPEAMREQQLGKLRQHLTPAEWLRVETFMAAR